MKTKMFLASLLILSFAPKSYSQTCSSSAGIDLSKNNGPFAALYARDQGQLGTCYAHTGSDLISSYLKTGRINIYQTAVANDTSMNGGSPKDVIDSFARLGSACTNTTLFKNLFPSIQTNIIGELQDTFIGSPIFYSIHAFEEKGKIRQQRIAELAASMTYTLPYEDALERFHEVNNQIKKLQTEIKKLEAQKSWWSSNTEINNKIKKINTEISALKKRADAHHSDYATGLSKLNRTNNLDDLSEREAAEVVYYHVSRQHLKFVSLMNKYGLKNSAPSLADFIRDRIKAPYAGAMYPYKVIKEVMDATCPSYQKTKIPSNLQGMSMTKKKNGVRSIQNKIDSLLEKNRQAISVSFHSSLLTGREGENHAVNIIGCRTNGRLTEYLVQNSWGQSCINYKASLKSKCSQGRIWIPATDLMNSMYEINWISKK